MRLYLKGTVLPNIGFSIRVYKTVIHDDTTSGLMILSLMNLWWFHLGFCGFFFLYKFIFFKHYTSNIEQTRCK
jgi:hypothetical protein